jgi:hypothetical protein
MIARWPHSRTLTTAPRIHSLPAASSPRIHHPPPVKLRARSVHAKVAPLRAIDVLPTLAGWTLSERELGRYTHASGAVVQAVNDKFNFFRATAQLLSGRLTYRDGECSSLAEACALALTPAAAEPVAAPQPTAAPATPHVFAVGQLVRHASGNEGVVVALEHPDAPGEVSVAFSKGALAGKTCGAAPSNLICLEPLTPATAPAPAGEREWRVGDRLVVTLACYKREPRGAVIVGVDANDKRLPVCANIDGGASGMWLKPGEYVLEPAPAVESERG